MIEDEIHDWNDICVTGAVEKINGSWKIVQMHSSKGETRDILDETN